MIVLQGHLSACSDADSTLYFPETIVLTGQERAMERVHLQYPFRVRLQDSLLYVMDLHATDYYIHQLSYPTMDLRQSLMRRGEAPAEFLDAENIRLAPDGSLWSLDANRRKMVRFPSVDSADSLLQIPLSEELIRTLDFCLLDDSTFVVPDYTGEHRMVLLDNQGQVLRRLFHIPAVEGGATASIALAQAWRPFMDYHAGHGLLAMVTQLGQVLEIYDIARERVVGIVAPQGQEPRFRMVDGYAVPTGMMGYSDVQIGREHIYALFWGHSFDDLKSGKVTREGGQYIHVFDLEGTPVRQYTLNRYLTGFHLDEDNRRFIGLDVNSNQPIVEYSWDMD